MVHRFQWDLSSSSMVMPYESELRFFSQFHGLCGVGMYLPVLTPG
jgi:hypothetical protein